MIKPLLSIKVIQFIYSEFVEACLTENLPVQRELSEKQLERIYSIIKSAKNAVFGIKLYPSIYHQVAFVLYQINKQHILLDGNKRLSLMVALYILDDHKIDHTKMHPKEWEDLVMMVAGSKHSLAETTKHLQEKLF